MSEDMKILGKRQVRLLNDVDVTTELKSGELNISMVSVDTLREIVGLSTTTIQFLLHMMK